MRTEQIFLDSVEHIQEFNKIMTQCEFDVDLVAGRFIVDAKSIMGILSLDLTKEVTLQIHGNPQVDFLEKIQKFISTGREQ